MGIKARTPFNLLRTAVAVLAMGLSGALFAQTPSAPTPAITDPPPAITFPDWREVPSEEDTSEFAVTFPSAIQTQYPENNVVPVRILMPALHDHPLPVVVVLHYWGATDQREDQELARELNARGIAAALVTLPYHLTRSPKGHRSGSLAVQPDTASLIQMMTQSVLDVRRAIDFLETRKEFEHDQIGIAGTSLGSLVSILTYALDSRIKSAAFLLGGVDLADIIWHSSRVVQVRETLRHKGYTEARLETELASIEPLKYLKDRKTGDTFVIGGRYDTVVPPNDTKKLIDALPNAKVLMLDTGHYGGIFVEKRLLRTVADFFGKEFQGSKYAPPMRLFAPTLRIGAILDSGDGFQLAAGIDLFKFGKKVPFFSSILATPKGLNLFAGFGIGQGFAIGGFATTRKVSAGIWWSTVL
ncbi:MAG TPA: prolyl oligopeptidase family serine peptidase [Fimbriimonadaceae bacterium]|jgi:dienelactone hydrolase